MNWHRYASTHNPGPHICASKSIREPAVSYIYTHKIIYSFLFAGLHPTHICSVVKTPSERETLLPVGHPQDSVRATKRGHYFLYATLQMIFAPSSVTSNEPSGNTAVHTGLPYTSLLPALAIKPVKKSSGLPEGFPFLKGTKATL